MKWIADSIYFLVKHQAKSQKPGSVSGWLRSLQQRNVPDFIIQGETRGSTAFEELAGRLVKIDMP